MKVFTGFGVRTIRKRGHTVRGVPADCAAGIGKRPPAGAQVGDASPAQAGGHHSPHSGLVRQPHERKRLQAPNELHKAPILARGLAAPARPRLYPR